MAYHMIHIVLENCIYLQMYYVSVFLASHPIRNFSLVRMSESLVGYLVHLSHLYHFYYAL